jgi:O-antigen/teichoic acid export membrane protein
VSPLERLRGALRGASKTKFFRDSFVLQIGGLLNTAGNFASSVALAHVLGADGQGLFYVAFALYSLFFFVLNLGLSQATVSQVAAASARGSTGKVAAWLAFLAKAYVLIGALLCAVGWFALPALARLLYQRTLTPDELESLGRLAWWLTLMPILEVARVVTCAGLHGTRRMLALAQIENGTELARVFLVVAGALITDSPLGPILGSVAGALIGSVLAVELYRAARRDGGPYPLPSVREIAAGVREVPIRQGIAFGSRIAVARNADAVFLAVVPPLVIQRFADSHVVAYFRVSQSIMRLPYGFTQGVSRTMMAALSECAGKRDMPRFRRTFVRGTVVTGLVTGGLLIGALPLVPWLVGVVYPADYRTPVATMALILAVGYVPHAFMVAADAFFIATGKLRAAIVLTVVGVAITMPLFAWVTASVPLTGAAWGMAFVHLYCFAHYAYQFWYFRTHPEFPPPATAPTPPAP